MQQKKKPNEKEEKIRTQEGTTVHLFVGVVQGSEERKPCEQQLFIEGVQEAKRFRFCIFTGHLLYFISFFWCLIPIFLCYNLIHGRVPCATASLSEETRKDVSTQHKIVSRQKSSACATTGRE